jgi:hypothetical protein
MTFEEFQALVAHEPLPQGKVCASAREAAMTAAHLALQHKRGTVLVRCATASDMRDVNDQLAAVFDSPLLKPAMMKRILVTPIDRRPRDLVANITYAPPVVSVSQDKADEILFYLMEDPVHVWRTIEHCISHHIYEEEWKDEALGVIAAVYGADDPEGYFQHRVAAHLAEIASRVPMGLLKMAEQNSGPLPDASISVAKEKVEKAPTRQEYIVSDEFEQHRAENIGKSEVRGPLQRWAITSRRSNPAPSK